MSASIALNVSRTGTIRSMADQFTSGTTFIQELLQNARRAGASEIQVSLEGRELVIEDDGHGINDPQTLLCIGESNWTNLEMVAEENPFGIGFASALFAADHIAVTSSDWHFATSTGSLLDFKPVELTTHATQREGTRIAMTVKESLCSNDEAPLSAEQYRDTLSYMTAAFPLPVYLNGIELERPLAKFCETHTEHTLPFGQLYGDALPTPTQKAVIFLTLQGFVIDTINPTKAYYRGCDFTEGAGKTKMAAEGAASLQSKSRFTQHPTNFTMINQVLSWDNHSVSVMELDSQKVRSRVPDRAVLIDHREKLLEISADIVSLRQTALEEMRVELSPEEFVDQHFHNAISNDAAHLLNDLPIPNNQLLAISGVEVAGVITDGRPNLPERVGPDVDCIFVHGSLTFSDLEQPATTTINSYVRNSPKQIVDISCAHNLHPDHWVFERAIDKGGKAPDCFLINAEPEDHIAQFTEILSMSGMITFEICEKVVLNPSNEKLPPVESADPIMGNDGIVYVSKHASHQDIESALLAISDYTTEDSGWASVDEALLEEDALQIKQMIELTSGGPKTEMIKNLLVQRLNLIAQHAQNNGVAEQYSVSFNADGTISVA